MGDEGSVSAAAAAARVLAAGQHEYGWFGGRANDLDDRHSVAFPIADATATGDRLTFRFAYKSAVVSGVCFGRSFVGLWRQSTGDGEVALEFTADFQSAEGWWTWPHEPARHRAFIRARNGEEGA
jgi:hypothetical protein